MEHNKRSHFGLLENKVTFLNILEILDSDFGDFGLRLYLYAKVLKMIISDSFIFVLAISVLL